MKPGTNTHHISVSVRLRPASSPQRSSVTVNEAGALVAKGKTYTYAANVVTGNDQRRTYEAVAMPLISQLREGYSCTLLAYGQTGSGKTHTIFGPPGVLTEASLAEAGGGVPESWGIFPRTIMDLLGLPGIGTLHASAVEVYQDKAYDLLADRAPLAVGSAKQVGRKVGAGVVSCLGNVPNENHHGTHPPSCRCGKCFRAQQAEQAARMAKRDMRQTSSAAKVEATQAPTDQFSTVGETFALLSTPADVAKLTRTIELTRTATGHLLNARSSRSHCLVHLHVTQREGSKVLKRKLLFVDLAGSERLEKSGVEGTAQAQAMAINGSLSTLGKVIRALSQKAAHIPYRDSTLTMLLRSSLGGRACTSVVINCAADPEHADETVCSLDFGSRMAAVRNVASVVIGEDAGKETEDLQAAMGNLREALRKLEADGFGGHFAAGAVPSEVRSCQANMKRIASEEQALKVARSQLAEAKATGDEAGIKAWEAKAQRHATELENLRMILLRQKSIPGFWIEPSTGYLAKQAELKDLEARWQLLGAC